VTTRVTIEVGSKRVLVYLDVPDEMFDAERVRNVLIAAVKLGASLLDAGTAEYPVQDEVEVPNG